LAERKEKKMKNPLVCILVGLIAGAALFAGFTLLDVALGNAPDFVSGMKSIRNIVIALVGVGGVAWTMWKKGSKEK
jgi:hypothetical protein